MRACFDAVVIGASVGGLAAAALLAKRGQQVLLLEDSLTVEQPVGALDALDATTIARLQLHEHGLRFTRQDLALTGWEEHEPALTISRDRRASARAIAAFSAADAQAWGPFRVSLEALAPRRWWDHPHRAGRAQDMLWSGEARARFAHLCLTGAEDFLRQHFESPRLIALLLADAVAGGFAPSEPGSALALVWRAAQQMAGQAGASAVPEAGTLGLALRGAARAAGVTLRFGAHVAAIRADDGVVSSVVLSDGEEIVARAVVSSLPRGTTEALAGLQVPPIEGAVGAAQLLFTVGDAVALPAEMTAGRVVLAAAPENYADAYEAARAGRLADMPLVCVADAPRRLAVTLPLAPVSPPGGWRAFQAPLAARVVKTLRRHIPGLDEALTGVTVMPPPALARPSLAQLLAPLGARVHTRISGLYLCGADAEPMPCVSGRAGRFAVKFVLKR